MSALRAPLALVAAIAAIGCGRDFDALFADGPDAGVAAPDAGTQDRGATPDADACAPTGSCDPRQECDDGTCSSTCAECCSCSRQVCPATARECRATCQPGSTCDVDCDTDGSCTLASHGATAKLTCNEHANRCDVTCDQGGSCEVRCDAEGPCAVTCAGGTPCVLTCTGRPTACELTCAGGAKKDCGGGVFTCERACPN